MSSTLYRSQKLENQSRLSKKLYTELRNIMKQYLQDEPDDSIMLANSWDNPLVKEDVCMWVTRLLEMRIGRKFWGRNRNRRWNTADHSNEILEFLIALSVSMAKTECRRRNRKHKRTREVAFEEDVALMQTTQDNTHSSPLNLHSSPTASIYDHEIPNPSKETTYAEDSEFSPQSIEQSSDTLSSSTAIRIIKTRLGPSEASTEVFFPLAAGFEAFVGKVREAWGDESKIIDIEKVKVKVFILGLKENRVKLGEDRDRSWSNLMKKAEHMPNSDIMVEFWAPEFTFTDYM